LKKLLIILIIILFSGIIYALPLKENVSLQRGSFFLHIKLGTPRHPIFGKELDYSSVVRVEGSYLFFLRHYGFTRYNIKTRKTVYFPVPDKLTKGRNLFSLYVSRRGIWIGSADGYLLYYGRKSKKWKKYSIAKGFKVIVSRIHNSLTASSFKLGSEMRLFDEKTHRFFKLFQFPKEIPVRPICTIRQGSTYWSGTTLGLFRFRKGYPNYGWQMCGTRDGLAKTLVTDVIPIGKYLLLSTIKAQSVYLAANLKYTSYGKFVYNYFQEKWQRKENADPQFLKLNDCNDSRPSGGIWLYNIKTDRAVKFKGLNSDIFHLTKLNKTRYLAAGRDGLYLLEFKGNNMDLMRLALTKRKMINGLFVSKKRVGFLIGSSFYLSDKKKWEDKVIINQSTRSSVDLNSQTSRNRVGKKVIMSDKRNQYQSEEGKFIQQVEDYLNRVK